MTEADTCLDRHLRIYRAGAVLCLLLTLAACSTGGTEREVRALMQEFLATLEAGDARAAASFFRDAGSQALAAALPVETGSEGQTDGAGSPGSFELRSVDVRRPGRAVAEVAVQDSESTAVLTFHLRYNDDSWYLLDEVDARVEIESVPAAR